MGFAINTNIAAMNSYRNLSSTQNDLSSSLEKLSSGLRINRAADDAAGLAISEGLRSQIGGLDVAARNAQDGISVIQTAEGALTEVHSILQRMRDLAVQAGNDSNNVESREAITTEANALSAELGRIAESTNFNGINLLDGSAGTAADGTLTFQIGANGDESSRINVDLSEANVAAVTNALQGLDATGAAATGASNYSNFTLAADEVHTFTAATGETFDVDVALGASDAEIKTALETAASDNGFTVTGDNVDGFTIVADSADVGAISAVDSAGVDLGGTAGNESVASLSFDSNAEAQASISLIDAQIQTISGARSELGASQNRFESAINTLNVSKENLSAAESRIRDTDMASEMMNFTRAQILSQAGTAMLAQANQSNQGVLQLLG